MARWKLPVGAKLSLDLRVRSCLFLLSYKRWLVAARMMFSSLESGEAIYFREMVSYRKIDGSVSYGK